MVGNNNRLEARVQHWPPTPAKHGLFRDVARVVKDAVSVPVCAVGRVTTVELANDILAAGDATWSAWSAPRSPNLTGKSAVVVGGGSGGLEAARRMARAGAEVTLAEVADHLRGQVAEWSLAPSRAEVADYIDWQARIGLPYPRSSGQRAAHLLGVPERT